ncbi:MAG: hypothetical protein COB85_01450 [Bacteroidetes bacterium]|nr:MAG: hypothetical protein COB85_01450 [Bacteroidota bacterium]
MTRKSTFILSIHLAITACVFVSCGIDTQVDLEGQEQLVGEFYREIPVQILPRDVKKLEIICRLDSYRFNDNSGFDAEPFSIRLKNLDPVISVKLGFSKEGMPDFSTNEAILNSIFISGMSDSEKARVMWSFICSRSFHAKPMLEQSKDAYDPVKLVNVYGYGYCDALNGALTNLAKLAGFKARYWSLKGHGVSEIYYDDSWHMFDASMQVYYTDDKNEVASVKYLEINSETILNSAMILYYEEVFTRYEFLVAKHEKGMELKVHEKYILENFGLVKEKFCKQYHIQMSDEWSVGMMGDTILAAYAGFFASAEDNQVDDEWKEIYENHSMILELGPGESIIYQYAHFTDESEKLMCYANKMKCFESTGLLMSNLEVEDGIIDVSLPAEIIFYEESPYAVTAIRIGLNGAEEHQNTKVYFSSNGMAWIYHGNLNEVAADETEIYYDLIKAFPELVFYNYWVKFLFDNRKVEHVQSIALNSEFVFSFLSVPYPSGDTASYILKSEWNTDSVVEGIKINLTWIE